MLAASKPKGLSSVSSSWSPKRWKRIGGLLIIITPQGSKDLNPGGVFWGWFLRFTMAMHGISSYTAMIVWYSKEVLQKNDGSTLMILLFLSCWIVGELESFVDVRVISAVNSRKKNLSQKLHIIYGWHHSNDRYCYSYNCNTHFKNFHFTPLSNLQPTVTRIEII